MIFESRKQAKNYTEGKDWVVYKSANIYYKDLPTLMRIKNRINKYWSYFIIWSGIFDIQCAYCRYKARNHKY